MVDNDGLHGPEERRGRAPLAAGLHAIRVEYFNRTGGQALELRAAPIGAAPAAVAPSALWHRGEAE